MTQPLSSSHYAYASSPPRSAEVLINTLEHERHTRGALVVAFADELRAAMADGAPESTRALLARAERGEMRESEYPVLLSELRASIAVVPAKGQSGNSETE